MNVVKMDTIENCIITIRGEKVLIDRNVAEIYGVETKRVNEAVKNNQDKFPEDYLFELAQDEKDELVENFDRFKRLKHFTANPKAFTEKGLYMLATILKSKKATETIFAIIEPQRSGTARGSLPFWQPVGRHERERARQTTVELNVAFLKVKHTIKKRG